MIKRNSLLLGDCLNLMLDIPNGSIDFICADLPYGTTNCSWDILIPFEPLWEHYKRIIKPNGAICLFAQTPFDKVLGASNLPMLRYEWIWEKTAATGHLNSKKMPMKAHENILVFFLREFANLQKTDGHIRKVSTAVHKRNSIQSEVYGNQSVLSSYDSTERYPRSVLRFASDKQKLKLHETQKPLALVEYFIKTYTNPGELVLDNCCGSGTVGVACINTGRDFIMMEKDPENFNKAHNRIYPYDFL